MAIEIKVPALGESVTEATVANGRQPNFFCARYTTNGHDIVQKCNTPSRSGVTRGMMQDMVSTASKLVSSLLCGPPVA